jgi:hypothetical protein
MEAIYSSETSVDFRGATWRYVPVDKTLHNRRCENIKSCDINMVLYFVIKDRLCGLVVRVPGYRSRSVGLDSRR